MLVAQRWSAFATSGGGRLVGPDRIPDGVQIVIREDLWLTLREISLESDTTNFRTGVCSTEL